MYLTSISLLSAALPAVALLLYFKKTTETLKYLGVFCVSNLIFELISGLLAYKRINNLYIFHLYTLIEFSFIFYIGTLIIQKKIFTRIAIIIAIAFSLLCIINALYIEKLNSINFLPRGIEGFMMLGLCIYFFYSVFVAEDTIDLLGSPYFWLFAGWLIYFAGTFFLFIYNSTHGFNSTYPIIHSVLNIFLNLVYTYVLWLGSKKLISAS